LEKEKNISKIYLRKYFENKFLKRKKVKKEGRRKKREGERQREKRMGGRREGKREGGREGGRERRVGRNSHSSRTSKGFTSTYLGSWPCILDSTFLASSVWMSVDSGIQPFHQERLPMV